jgi:hypothetical protein
MKVLVVVDAVLPGGAEIFALRMTNALAAVGHEVVLFVVSDQLVDMDLVKGLAQRVRIVGPKIKGRQLFSKLDGLLFRLGLPAEIVRSRVVASLNDLTKNWSPNIIHSHLYQTDLVVSKSQLG